MKRITGKEKKRRREKSRIDTEILENARKIETNQKRQRVKEAKRQRQVEMKSQKRQRDEETKRRRQERNKGRRKKISRDEEIIRQRGNFKETKRTKGRQRKRWIKGGEHFVFHGNTRLVCVQPTRNYL